MRGFILQPTYRIESGRPVIHLYGRLESGDPFLVRDDSQIPHFFVRASDQARAAELGAARIRPTKYRTMAGEPVVRVEVAKPADTPPLRDRLKEHGIPAYEADVRFAMRYLIDRGIRGGMEIEAVSEVGQRGTFSVRPGRIAPPGPDEEAPAPLRVYERPLLTPVEWAPELRVLSFDIETDPRGRKLYAISLHGCGAAEVLYVTPSGAATSIARMEAALHPDQGAPEDQAAGPDRFRSTACRTEADLLRLFCRRVEEIDPDVLTGWNVIDFDLRVMDSIARRVGAPLRLGRTPEPVRLRLEPGARASSRAEVVGRVVLDGIEMLRGAFVRLEDYRLETAARALLGEGKLIAARDRADEIDRLYHEDLPRFLAYSFTDSRLVTEILEKTGVVTLAVRRSLLTGMPPDRVGASIASFDSLYLHELRERGFVAPSVGAAEVVEETAGGAVLEPVTGFHDNVLVFDFRSLYPSLIRTYNIDPLGLIPEPAAGEKEKEGDRAAPQAGRDEGAEPIRAPNGARFHREPGILPGMLDRLFGERAAARARGDAIASQAIKILMNSCYGVLATPACRFYSSRVANAITLFGQETLLWAKERAESMGYEVIYGDTDSLFIKTGTEIPAEARSRGEELRERLNREIREHVRESFALRSHLELEFERLYLRLFLPPLRHGTTGARKRYAGLVEEGGMRSVQFVGMEIVRRDWTELSKIFQRELFERIFRNEDVAPYVLGFVEELRAGEHDNHLVYRKALRKPVNEYTATTPPHVKAAKLLGARAGRLIEYVMTVNGPEPAVIRKGAFDYEHYIEKQIRPVAEAVLTHLGHDFDRILGRPGAAEQLELF